MKNDRATVTKVTMLENNGEIVWAVHVGGVLERDFASHYEAHQYANFLNNRKTKETPRD